MVDDINKVFGEHLKRIRKSKGKTQEFIADTAGISDSYLSNIELGQVSPRLQVLYKISRALDMSLADLFSFEKPNKDVKSLPDMLFVKQEIKKLLKEKLNQTTQELLDEISDLLS